MSVLAPVASSPSGISAAEFETFLIRNAESGLRFELLQGEIVIKMGQGSIHALVMSRVIEALIPFVSREVGINAQSTVRTSELDVPEPDAFLFRKSRQIDGRGFLVADLLLVVEIAVTSLRRDREVNSSLYSQAKIPEYWIVNPTAHQLEVRRIPVNGRYSEVSGYGPGEVLAPLFKPEIGVEVDQLLLSARP